MPTHAIEGYITRAARLTMPWHIKAIEIIGCRATRRRRRSRRKKEAGEAMALANMLPGWGFPCGAGTGALAAASVGRA